MAREQDDPNESAPPIKLIPASLKRRMPIDEEARVARGTWARCRLMRKLEWPGVLGLTGGISACKPTRNIFFAVLMVAKGS